MKEKYLLLKRIHPDRFIIFKIKQNYITFGQDLEIVRHLKLKKLFKRFEQNEISYMIIDKDLTIIKSRIYDNTNYRYLLKKIFIIKLIRRDCCE